MNTPALSLAELRQKPHWSFSALNTFLNTCSLQWAFRYVWKLPPVSTPAALVFGGVFHSACTFAFRARLAGRDLPVTPALDLFGDLFAQECRTAELPVQFREEETPDTLVRQGQGMLQALLTDPVCRADQILAVGEVFRVPLPQAGGAEPKPLIGEYDLVVQAAGGCIIVDWKTAARRWPEGKAESDLQPTCYLYARSFTDDLPARFRFDVVTKTAKPTVTHLETLRSEDRFLRLEALLQVVSAMVRAEHFLPAEQSWSCSDCQYAEACAAWHRSRARVSATFSRAA
jgi:putative RecB family exonuclease